jgi:hypothetical protein
VLTWPRPRVGHLAWASQPQPMGRHGKQNILRPYNLHQSLLKKRKEKY